ncbi:MAG: serpin family protein [Actinobacteria bacterium]|nr:serpin family protein [Actinomycetota bacterium]MBI3686327.1 serpin family protein [Actinomycetota bacterium]
MNEVALALHRPLAVAAGRSNLVWSPYSVAAALAVVGTGAAGRTRKEFVDLLGDLDELGAVLRPAATPDPGGASSPPELAVVNTVWLRQDLEPTPAYLSGLRSWPAASVRSADFAGASERVRLEINAEVAATTHGLIRDLLGAGTVRPDSCAVAVNALWLRVAWWPDFPEQATAPAPFHAPTGERAVPTMRRSGSLRYAQVGGWRAVTLTTTGPIAVDILLPDGDLAVAEQELTPRLLHTLGQGTPTDVELALPRFRVAGDVPLDEVLPAVGLVTAFTGEADFSGITETEPLRIDRVVHRAVLAVDERGLEGAAATAVVMITASAHRADPVPFHVDRPFLVVVRHQPTGAIYFLARVTEP